MSDFTLGQHDAQLRALEDRSERIEASVSGMHSKIDSVITTLAERRGERKTIAVLATLAGGLGSVVITVLLKIFVG